MENGSAIRDEVMMNAIWRLRLQSLLTRPGPTLRRMGWRVAALGPVRQLVRGLGRRRSRGVLAVSVGDHNNSFFKLGWDTLNFSAPADYLATIGRDSLPFGEGQVRFMNASHVVEHLRTPALKQFLAEARRVLQPRGILRICVPDLQLFLDSYRRDGLQLHYGRRLENGLTMRETLELQIKDGKQPPGILEPHNGLVSIVASYTNGEPAVITRKDLVEGWLDRGDIDGFVEWCVSLKQRADNDYGHFNAYTFSRLERFLREGGFQRVTRSAYGSDCDHPLLRGIDRPAWRQISLYVSASPG
jgi:SAM-dependent methyltransferase